MNMTDINTFSNGLSENVLALGVLGDLLADLGFEYDLRTTKRGDQYIGRCPIHNGEDPEHCVVYAGEKICWQCFSRGCHARDKAIKPSLLGFVRACLSIRQG